MTDEIIEPRVPWRLEPFQCAQALRIAEWVRTDEELHHLAPSTLPPMTPQKVLTWKKPGGSAWVLTDGSRRRLVAYGELNPMGQSRTRSGVALDIVWIGHVIVRPDQRGRGAGRVLMQTLVRHAFRRLHANRVVLVVFPDNVAAIRCYRRAGFTVVGHEYHRFVAGGPRHRLARLEIRARAARQPDGRDRALCGVS